MFCRKCGANVSDDAGFCPQCGSAVVSEPSDPISATSSASTAPSASTASTAATATTNTKRNAIIGAAAAAAVVVAVLAVLFFTGAFGSFGGIGSGSAGGGYEGSRYVVISANGTKVISLERPTMATLSDEEGGELAAPALKSYVTSVSSSQSQSASSGGDSSEGTQSSQSSGDSQSSQTSQDAQGSDDSQSSDGSASATGDSTASATSTSTDAEANPLGTIEDYEVEEGLANVVNLDSFQYSISDEIADALVEDGFVVDASSGDAEFYETYETNRYGMQASFVTVDSIMHTYHLYFSHLLKQTEKSYLASSMASLSQSMLEASASQLETLRGTEWEDAAKRNCVFFGVGCLLLGQDAQVPEELVSQVEDEVAKVQAASGIQECSVTGDQEDYTQYKPRGYYEGDEQLESYFRAMMWYGRINFTQNAKEHEDPSDLNRSALLITIALNGDEPGQARSEWESVYTVTSFFAGAADDCGYYEYYPLFQAAYGEDATVESLVGNESAWNDYNDMTSQMQAPRISSVVVGDEESVTDDDIKGFRFMGQRFSLDESIFQQLTHDEVKERMLPSALDLTAALGSQEALSILEEEGETSYEGYDEQMETIRADIANSDDSIWTGSLYSQWLYTLNPLLTVKGEGYPSFMQSDEWTRKNLQTYLGSYTELKHDTVLYSKQTMSELGGGSLDYDDRGYVEPEPEVYARLSNLVQSTSDGLAGYGMLSDADSENLSRLKEISSRLETMATKELSGEVLSDDEYDFIREYGGQLEHFWDEVNPDVTNQSNTKARESPAAVVVDVATDATGGTVLELGTGQVRDIYVVVPIDGELHLCRGAVYSYYEFEWPSSDRLTDSEWRDMLGLGSGSYTQSADLPDNPEWTQSFSCED